MTLFTEVTGKTKRNLDPNQIGYFINESIFNSLGSAYIFSPQYFKPNLTTPVSIWCNSPFKIVLTFLPDLHFNFIRRVKFDPE